MEDADFIETQAHLLNIAEAARRLRLDEFKKRLDVAVALGEISAPEVYGLFMRRVDVLQRLTVAAQNFQMAVQLELGLAPVAPPPDASR